FGQSLSREATLWRSLAVRWLSDWMSFAKKKRPHRSPVWPLIIATNCRSDFFRNRNSLWQREVRVRFGRQNLGDARLGGKLRRRRHRCSLDLHFLIPIHAGARRDEVTDDDVLLESEQLVTRAANCGIGQNARRLLEARRRDERLSRETRLRDSEKEWLRNRRCLLFLLGLVVRLSEGLLVDVLALEE